MYEFLPAISNKFQIGFLPSHPHRQVQAIYAKQSEQSASLALVDLELTTVANSKHLLSNESANTKWNSPENSLWSCLYWCL